MTSFASFSASASPFTEDDTNALEPVANTVVEPEDAEQVDVALHRCVDGLEVDAAPAAMLARPLIRQAPSALSRSSAGVGAVSAPTGVVGFDDRRLLVFVVLTPSIEVADHALVVGAAELSQRCSGPPGPDSIATHLDLEICEGEAITVSPVASKSGATTTNGRNISRYAVRRSVSGLSADRTRWRPPEG
jgi:hypothetical protein